MKWLIKAKHQGGEIALQATDLFQRWHSLSIRSPPTSFLISIRRTRRNQEGEGRKKAQALCEKRFWWPSISHHEAAKRRFVDQSGDHHVSRNGGARHYQEAIHYAGEGRSGSDEAGFDRRQASDSFRPSARDVGDHGYGNPAGAEIQPSGV